MKVIFESIEIEGFRSVVKPLSFQLNRPGLNLIKGVNGSGKTSVIEALVWCLFGINLKETTIGMVASWPEVRGSNWLGTRVSVNLTINRREYTIYRHLEYKGLTEYVRGDDSLMIFVDGVMDGKDRNKDLTQQTINQLLGVDAKTFMNSIIFGQRMAKLIEQDNGDKRKLFETLFESEWVNQAKIKCDAKLGQLASELLQIDVAIMGVSSTIEDKRSSLQVAESLIAGFEQGRQLRLITKLTEQQSYLEIMEESAKIIDSLQESQNALNYASAVHDDAEAVVTALDLRLNLSKLNEQAHNNKINNLKSSIIVAKTAVIRLKTAYDKLEAKDIKGECPYCAQELMPGNQLETNHKNDLRAAKAEWDAAIANVTLLTKQLKDAEAEIIVTPTELIAKIAEATDTLAVLDNIYTQWNDLETKVAEHMVINTQVKKGIIKVEKEIEIIKAEIPPKTDIEGMERMIKDKETELVKLKEDRPKKEKEIEIAKWWSTKGLGSGGIKAFIFKAMLSQLNQSVKKYGERLGVSMEFSIDLTKTSKPFTTICSVGNKLNKDYREFSGGQKQRLDIVLIFAMHDLISINTDMNLLIMDEAMEGLDEEGETAVFDLIRSKADGGKSVYVITHSSTLDSLYSNTIEFQSINGNTNLIN